MMILSASTLGAPGAGLDQVLDWLAVAGVRGVELRLAPGEIAEPGMAPERRRRLTGRLEAAGVELTGLASYVRVAQKAPDDGVVGELSEALELAAELGAPAVRVFPGAPEDAHDGGASFRGDAADGRAAARLSRVAGLAERLGVLPVLETHDSHPRGADVARIASLVEGPVGVVWDLMHPWRTGEALEETWQALRPWLGGGRGSVQVKDAALPDTGPTLIGAGTLPCREFGELLRREGYDGTVTLELEAAWYPSAPPFPEALASAARWYAEHVARAGQL